MVAGAGVDPDTSRMTLFPCRFYGARKQVQTIRARRFNELALRVHFQAGVDVSNRHKQMHIEVNIELSNATDGLSEKQPCISLLIKGTVVTSQRSARLFGEVN
jgi:hypothetical protein